jgi:hypothetical protein
VHFAKTRQDEFRHFRRKPAIPHALTLALLAALALVHVLLFRWDIQSGTLRIPGGFTCQCYDIIHQFTFREGFHVTLGISLAMLMFGGVTLRHALARWRRVAIRRIPNTKATVHQERLERARTSSCAHAARIASAPSSP